MKTWVHMVLVAALLLACAAGARAESEPAHLRTPAPGAALGAALANVLFVPLRLGVTVVAAELGGFTGFMTAGNHAAADDVWDLFRGQAYLTPEFIKGEEPVLLGSMEF